MRVLALDTTTRAGSAAVIVDGRVLAEHVGDGTRTHAERLPRELLEVLEAAGMRTADIDLFAVACGPGSFTGLRIGIATIQGLAFVHQRPVAPVSVLRALAEVAVGELPVGARAGAWMDAARREVFSALYDVLRVAADGGVAELAEVEGPRVGVPLNVVARWNEAGAPQAVCGDGAALYAAVVPPGTTIVPAPPLAGTIGRLAPLVQAVHPAGVQPLYVRRSDAELARDAVAQPR
ncbi:MAG: tRNA (adenosine(37)-N6)-threonylcarbamoyltransferase complex dimerization subunit type 1 TsaB [Acidobacteria bacterium]|nr:tRNA (adenosine(37)-N6)-threonylcarbamoyltransferase complex dimerization subunit type 1 TsaB [Acidobacteriota bacterium]